MRFSMIMSAPSPSQRQFVMPIMQGNIQKALHPPMPHIYGTLATNQSFADHYHDRPVVYTPCTHSPLRVFLDSAPTANQSSTHNPLRVFLYCAPAGNQLGCTYSTGPITQCVQRMNLASLQSASVVSWTMTDNAPIQPSEK
ncbi:hypothetical protein O181_112888 [Austropuccinia psidii MF-1]|uniref:Uncharacterized protein n=1 Tax=Austropuccinia psidii MF-1 TaxID=1389203 RepID=A0A9Q3K1B6_9BASI|nr:hypothetical protein [Austropuccinia psidii MF-1]